VLYSNTELDNIFTHTLATDPTRSNNGLFSCRTVQRHSDSLTEKEAAEQHEGAPLATRWHQREPAAAAGKLSSLMSTLTSTGSRIE
jgi:hypothetical protein